MTGVIGMTDVGLREAFDRFTRLGALLTGAPMAVLGLLGSGHSEWASAYGTEGPGESARSRREIPLDASLCGVVLAAADEVVIEDVSRHPSSAGRAMVRELGVAAWAGFPVLDLTGVVVGTVCALDVRPRSWSEHDRDVLATLARAASGEIALREGLRRAEETGEVSARTAEELQVRVQNSARQAASSERLAADAQRLARLAEEHAAEADELAATLRESLLPARLPQFPGLEVAARYRPGTGGSVLGDFYDLFPTPGGWGTVVGDVCGKGPQAARTTALARSTVRAFGHTDDDPYAVLGALHGVLHVWFDQRPSFVTLAYAAMRPHTEGFAVSVASAGHPPAVVHRATGEVEVLAAGGRALGIGEEAVIAVEDVVLGLGDRILLYTDGVTEAHPPRGEQFEVDGVVAVLEGLGGGGSADEAADAVVEAALRHAAGASTDDTALVVLRVTGIPAGAPHPSGVPHPSDPGAPPKLQG